MNIRSAFRSRQKARNLYMTSPVKGKKRLSYEAQASFLSVQANNQPLAFFLLRGQTQTLPAHNLSSVYPHADGSTTRQRQTVIQNSQRHRITLSKNTKKASTHPNSPGIKLIHPMAPCQSRFVCISSKEQANIPHMEPDFFFDAKA